jgi:CHASE2 domain-containing sensor protein
MVIAQIWIADASTPMQTTGSLPAAPDLSTLYSRWQRLYEALYAHRSWRSSRTTADEFEIETDEAYPTDISETEFKQLCAQCQQALNQWLSADGFRAIDRHLRTQLTPNDEIQVIITAENRQLLRLPWHLWQFFEDYPKAEAGLSLPDYRRSLKTPVSTPNRTVNILAILGNSTGIDITSDQQQLQQLPDVKIQFLVEPRLAELHQQIWQPGWDILFFAGHSSGNRAWRTGNQGSGRFQINTTESLTVDQLKFALKKAIQQGLKLAIFNSCDGLDLAWDLAELQIPQVIVMREAVPDRVAQEFLKHFLTAFFTGQSLYLAVREAREKLQGLETDFLGASWLPVICQNPAELPMCWEWGNRGTGEGKEEEQGKQPFKSQKLKAKITRLLILSIFTTVCLVGVRAIGSLQPLELWAFDRFLQLRPKELPDNRFLIITIDETDIQAQAAEQRQGSLSDQALEQLLKILEQHQARVVGLDIYRDFPVSSKYPGLMTQLRQNKRLVTICKSSDAKFDPTGIAPPPEVLPSSVGFSDFLEDSDGVVRRQLLFQSPDPASPCVAPYAFSTRIAFRYLEAERIPPQFTVAGDLKLGQAIFQRLRGQTGGYQTIDAAGNQILLNYRSLPSLREIAPQVSLTQVLQGKVHPEAIKNRIVLVGVTANSSSDVWITPYGSGTADKIPGVMIQAHMTSQLISAVLNQRSLIAVWNGTAEVLWVGLWAIAGGICASFHLSSGQRGVMGMTLIGILTGSCFFLFVQGIWVPFVPAGVATLITVGISSYLDRKIDHTP